MLVARGSMSLRSMAWMDFWRADPLDERRKLWGRAVRSYVLSLLVVIAFVNAGRRVDLTVGQTGSILFRLLGSLCEVRRAGIVVPEGWRR